MISSRILVISCLLAVLRVGYSQTNTTLAQCGFEANMACNFQIIPDLHGVDHRELWKLSFPGNRGPNSPEFDHTPGDAADVFASSVSLVSTPSDQFKNFSTKIISADMNFTTGTGHVTFYYYLWIADDPRDREDTYPTLNVRGCNRELLWSARDFTGEWVFAELDFTCAELGHLTFEAFHRQPGSGVAIDDVIIIDTPVSLKGDFTPSAPTDERAPSDGPTLSTSTGFPNQTTVAVGEASALGGHVLHLAIGLLLGAILIFIVSITIHCYFWRKRRRLRELKRGSSTGLHVSNTGYDYLTRIAGVSNGNHGNTGKTMASESTMLTTISNGLSGSSYQMDVISEKNAANPSTDGSLEGTAMAPKGRRLSRTLPLLRKSRGSRDRSFEYAEISDISPTDENMYQFPAKSKKSSGKTPKLGIIGRSMALIKSSTLPSRKSVESTGSNKMEGPYHITDLIGHATLDSRGFPGSLETVAYDELSSNKGLVGNQQSTATSNSQTKVDPHVYKELEPRDKLDSDDYDLLKPVSQERTQPAVRNVSDYEKPPVSPKPSSPLSPKPMSPKQKSHEQLPSIIQQGSQSYDHPSTALVLRDPKYYTLVPDLVKDASYEYPVMMFEGDGTRKDSMSDADSNAYESFERPDTPKDKQSHSRRGSKQKSLDNERKYYECTTPNPNHPTLVKQQLAKFLDDDYENIV